MCLRPIHLKIRGVTVPCNRCPRCIARRTSAWSFRLMEEEKVSTSAHFLTLTYATTNVPISSNGNLTLSKRDVQLFFKRLRKVHAGLPIKYYTVGEYGGRTKRPHYHAIIFNALLDDLQPSWQAGSIYYGNVTAASVGYTLKYMMKHKKQRIPFAGVQPEFSLMSKGLGISYLSETMANWHVEDLTNRMYCSRPGNIKIAMPRYYKDKLYLDLEKAAIRDAYQIINDERQLKKIMSQSTDDIRDEMAAIDAAYDRMYLSSFKTKL